MTAKHAIAAVSILYLMAILCLGLALEALPYASPEQEGYTVLELSFNVFVERVLLISAVGVPLLWVCAVFSTTTQRTPK